MPDRARVWYAVSFLLCLPLHLCAHISLHTMLYKCAHTHTHTYKYIYIRKRKYINLHYYYTRACVCVRAPVSPRPIHESDAVWTVKSLSRLVGEFSSSSRRDGARAVIFIAAIIIILNQIEMWQTRTTATETTTRSWRGRRRSGRLQKIKIKK